MTEKRYYIGKGESPKGQYKLNQLRAAVREGALAASAQVRAEGETEALALDALLRQEAPPRDASRLFSDEDDPMRRVFCDTCYADSSPGSPRELFTFNGFGTTFYGRAERCPRCRSSVRVHWVVLFGFPVLPLGSYRSRQVSRGFMSARYLARRTHTRTGQVVTHWAVAVAICAAIIGAVVLFVLVMNRIHG